MTSSEQRRDAGVIFENPAVARQAETHARREEEPPPGRAHARDAGVTFEGGEVRVKGEAKAAAVAAEQRVTERPAPETKPAGSARGEEAASGARSHDAGVVFENAEAPERAEPAAAQEGGSLSGLMYSIAGLGGAATKFTMDQMKYAFRMMTDPLHAVGHMQHSIDKVSTALMQSVEGEKQESDSNTLKAEENRIRLR